MRTSSLLLTVLVGSVVACAARNSDGDGDVTPTSSNAFAGVGVGQAQEDREIADPDVLVDDGGLWLTGTNNRNPTKFPLYRGTDPSSEFRLMGWYVPHGPDSYKYCHLWAPNLVKVNSGYRMWFTAKRVEQAAPCGGIDEISVWYVDAPSVAAFYDGTVLTPSAYTKNGANAETVMENRLGPASMRIDPDELVDGASTWVSYVYFQDGNRIAAFDRSSPTSAPIILVGDPPTPEPLAMSDDGVAIYEAPDLVKAGDYYLVYSVGGFDRDYALWVKRAATMAGLASATPRQLTFPLYDGSGARLESAGHSSVFMWNDKPFIAYHVGTGVGANFARNARFSELAVDSNGDVLPLTQILDGATGTVPLRNRNSGKCIDVPNGHEPAVAVNYGLQLSQYSCNGYAAQQWTIINLPDRGGHGGGYLLRSKATGLCLTAEGGVFAGARIAQRPCTGVANQRFKYEVLAENYLQISPAVNRGLCLEIESGLMHDRAAVMLWNCTGLPGQQWSAQ